MKIPSIKHIIKIRKINRERQFLDNYVHIDNNIPNRTAVRQMYKARKGIANYAQDKGVSIDIFNARQELGEHDSPILEDYFSDKLSLHVTDLLTSKSEQKIISARTDVTHTHVVPDYIVIDYADDGIQQTRLTTHEYEDTFLRHLYRNIENLVKSVQNRK